MLRTAACLGAILAAGCGGGGGGGEAPPELLQITNQNQIAVARAVTVNFMSLGSMRDIPISDYSAGGAQASALAGITKQALGTAIEPLRAAGSRFGPLAIQSETELCPAGGSLTITVDDRDNNGLPSAGDVLTMAFNNCRPESSSSINGSVRVDIAVYVPSQLSGLFTFGQLTLVDGDDTVSANGAANAVYTETVDPSGTMTIRTELTVASAGLVTSGSTPGYTETLTHDSGFNAVWTDVVPNGPPPYSTSALRGRVHVGSLGNRIILTTDPAVHDLWSAEFPDSGVVTIDGYRSHLRLRVMSTSMVRLELDSDDDGTFEAGRDMAWTELMPF
jgi:hypothetical protein